MRYDPECEYSRQHLAITIVSKLTESGFTRVEEDGARVSSTPWQVKEHLYERDIDDIGLKVQVYTTVVDDNALGLTVRATGRDAIRVTSTPCSTRPASRPNTSRAHLPGRSRRPATCSKASMAFSPAATTATSRASPRPGI